MLVEIEMMCWKGGMRWRNEMRLEKGRRVELDKCNLTWKVASGVMANYEKVSRACGCCRNIVMENESENEKNVFFSFDVENCKEEIMETFHKLKKF